ncbi:hypothetical protein EZV62_008789 [Acer yangbiense]|uniref:DRBM domain-containing protein n=1 Tax=Acer yangbiense TaxID=1000413 RepID=A0A5C7IEU5_9ROSI|nr:hypothetical protein EZV62_008789 [Acer yangbiense]
MAPITATPPLAAAAAPPPPSPATSASSSDMDPLLLSMTRKVYTTSKSRPFEYLRLTSLSVIGAPVDDTQRSLASFSQLKKFVSFCAPWRWAVNGPKLNIKTKPIANVFVDGEFVASCSSDQKEIAKLNAAKVLRKLYLSYHNLFPLMLELGMFEVFKDMDGNFEIEGAKPKLHEICMPNKLVFFFCFLFLEERNISRYGSLVVEFFWYALLQEIVLIYPVLSSPNLTIAQSNRVCNALALLQCVASSRHKDAISQWYVLKTYERLLTQISLYMYPFLKTTSKSRPYEYLRLTSLGVISALVKVDDTQVISFILSINIITPCLLTMEMGSELSKTVATFIVQKILLDDVGLDYVCTTAESLFALGRVLGNMVAALAEQPSSRLFKQIIRCYLRLSDNARACYALCSCLPDMLRDGTFSSCLREDPTTRHWLQQLLYNVHVS